MKKYLLLIHFIPLILYAQFIENFDNGNFTTPQSWHGDTLDFIVNDSLWLQLSGPAESDEKYLSTDIATFGATTWRFKIYYDFLNPSSNNFARFYLKSDNRDLINSSNSIYIQIGGISGSDDAVTLNKQTDNNISEICSSATGIAANNNFFSVEVIKDSSDLWSLFLDMNNDGNFSLESSCYEEDNLIGSYVGFYTKYTSSRNNAYLLDDVLIDPVYEDTDAPVLLSVNVLSENRIELVFNETLNESSVQEINNYFVDQGIGNPIIVLLDETQKIVELTFSNTFPVNQTLTINIENVEDQNSNIIDNISIGFIYYEAQEYDLLITEIFADVEPQYSLPTEEYIEIYNNSNLTIDLEGIVLSDAVSETVLPSYDLMPDNYLILCDESNAGIFEDYGLVLGVNSFPTLNNSSDIIRLRFSDSLVFHEVAYNDNWYKDEIKSQGGFSLEMIDLTNTCDKENNWKASEDERGGTPGIINSVNGPNLDLIAPIISNISSIDAFTISFEFSESVGESAVVDLSNYSLENEMMIEEIFYSNLDYTCEIYFSNAMQSGVKYNMIISNIFDCAGNEIENEQLSFAFVETSESNDLLINEILFNPVSGGYDYVELYNNSNKVTDLLTLRIAKADTISGTITSIEEISDQHYMFYPGEYIALTENRDQITDTYLPPDSANIIEVSDLPSYNDDQGIVILLNEYSVEVDHVHYFEDWHYSLINNKNGVALERINFEAESNSRDNWHTSSSLNNYGTPGYRNSQNFDLNINNGVIEIYPKVFSPDSDGYEDYLTINFGMESPGWIGNIIVYDQQGRFIKQIIKNSLLSQNVFFKWDGTDHKGDKNPVGIYLIYIELFNTEGEIAKYKKSCAIIYNI